MLHIWPWQLRSELRSERERRERAEEQLARLRRAVADLPAPQDPHRRTRRGLATASRA